MDAELKAKWLSALRSGEWTQTRGEYFDRETGGYCCLGVLTCLAMNVKGEDGEEYEVAIANGGERSAGPSEVTQRLIDMNDHEDKSFAEIADWVEANL